MGARGAEMKFKKFRYMLGKTRTNTAGKHVVCLGARLEYWPCLKGPFFSIEVGIYRIDIWYGYESHK